MAQFIQACHENVDPQVDGEAGLIAVQVGLAAKASLDQDIPIRVDYS
jgi:hypothetical protein